MRTVRVQIPFLAGRSYDLAVTKAAYWTQATREMPIYIDLEADATWGEGQNIMFRRDRYPADYFLLGCDDAVPHLGAVQSAIDFHRSTGDLPGCRFLQDGEPLDPSYDARPHGEETPWCRLFLLTQSIYNQVGPLLDLTWYTDIDYCQRLNEAGYRIRMCDGFTFDHLDPPRTWAVDGEVERQRAVYHEACVAAGRSPLA